MKLKPIIAVLLIFLVTALSISFAAETTPEITPPEEGSEDCFERGGVCNTSGFECSGTKNGRMDDACCPVGTKWDLGAGLCTPECVDEDFDGFGFYESLECRFPEQDCDDSDGDVNPFEIERCDGKDNNCNGEVDEICDSSTTNPPTTNTSTANESPKCKIGVCINGDMDCDGFTDRGCLSPICNPLPETCNKKDDDCDSVIDDGVDCSVECSKCGKEGILWGIFNPCDEKECKTLGSCNFIPDGWWWGSCINAAPLQNCTLEIINGIDDDCDGFIDEDVNYECFENKHCNGDEVCVGFKCEKAKVILSFIPYNWKGSLDTFDGAVKKQADFFKQEYPLNDCKERVRVNVVKNKCDFKEACGCSDLDNIKRCYDKAVTVPLKVGDKRHFIIGLTDKNICGNIVGLSCRNSKVYAEKKYSTVTAHEVGHEFNLTDEYNSIVNGEPNPLKEEYGCDPNNPSCCYSQCTYDSNGCNICCKGNYARGSTTGRSIMSSAKAPGPRRFSVPAYEHLKTYESLTCEVK